MRRFALVTAYMIALSGALAGCGDATRTASGGSSPMPASTQEDEAGSPGSPQQPTPSNAVEDDATATSTADGPHGVDDALALVDSLMSQLDQQITSDGQSAREPE